MSPEKRHRHFVALPLFLAFLGCSLLSAWSSSGSLIGSVAGQKVQSLSDGAQVFSGDDSVFIATSAVPFLRRGTALVRTEGIVQVRTPSCDILALAGAFHVSAGDAVTTVSAITAPVLVSVAGEKALIPLGTQLRIAGTLTGIEAGFAAWRLPRAVQSLPEHFLEEQLLALRQFPPADDFLPAAESALPSAEQDGGLILPAAQERAEEARRLSVLGALRGSMERQEEQKVLALLDLPAYHSALSDPRSLPVLVALAARSEKKAVQLHAKLLGFLAHRHDLWLLAALHPAFSAGAWSVGMPALSSEERLLLAFGLPEADRSSQGFSPVIVRWWEQEVATFIAEQKEPLALVEPLLAGLLPVVEQDVKNGYPERAQMLVRALKTFAEPVALQLSTELQADLTRAQKLAEARVTLFVPPADSSVSLVSSASSVPSASFTASLPPVDPNERVSIVTAELEQAGALFSLQTRVQPVEDGQSVSVRDILFSSSKGDRAYAFTVDVRTRMVSSIVQDGKTLPYPMAWDAFLVWVRR